MLATVGCVRPLVARRPRVGIIATGDELVEPENRPGPSQIRNSNSFQLFAQAADAGAAATYFGIAPDTFEGTDRIVKQAMAASDVLLLSGGVSVGDFDLVPGVLESNGIQIQFRGVAMKPGKPTHFGLSEHAYCFGLPGNPVSTFIQFELLIRPFLHALMGHDLVPRMSRLPLAEAVHRKRIEREAWLPVAVTARNTVHLLEYHGSAHINALGRADGLIVVPTGVADIAAGTIVDVRHI
jgi:molybdopterin molybdotransferase